MKNPTNAELINEMRHKQVFSIDYDVNSHNLQNNVSVITDAGWKCKIAATYPGGFTIFVGPNNKIIDLEIGKI